MTGTRGTHPEGAPCTIADLHAAYRDGRVTPTDVMARALAAAQALDRMTPPVRAWIALNPDDVRTQADASTVRWRAGAQKGPLDGVPVAIKDEIDVAGYPSTHGTSFLGRESARRDSLVVRRLRQAGAVIFGKTNMHELGTGPSGANPHHGAVRNPYDLARDTGGSSSGSAAAVAAGVVPIALGTDSGGSVRIPSSLCGVASIKGTFGAVPTEGAVLRAWSLEHVGPIGISIDDVAIAYGVLAEQPCDLESLAASRSWTFGICDAWWSAARSDVATIVRATIARRVEHGARERAVALFNLALARPVATATFGVECAVSAEQYLAERRPLSASVRLTLELARGISATAYVKAQRARTLLARDFDAAFEQVDFLITPTTAVTAPRYRAAALGAGEIDEALIDALVAFTIPLNLVGLPAAQVRCGYDSEGLPVGLQIIGPRGSDARVLAVAREIERETRWEKPVAWHDLLG